MNTITRTDTPIDVTAVRRQLVQQGDEQLAQRRPFFKVMHGTLHGRQDAPRIEDVDGAAAWAYEGLVSAGTFAHTLAYVLRLLEQDAPEVALKVAAVVERVLDAGMDALEDANADLDEQTVPAQPETTPAWHRGHSGPDALPPEVMIPAKAEDWQAAILTATAEAIKTRGTDKATPPEPTRIEYEVTLRKADDR